MTADLTKLEEGLARVYVNDQRVVVGGAYTHTNISAEEKAEGTEAVVSLEDWFVVDTPIRVVETDGTIRAATESEALSVLPVPEEVTRYQFLTQLTIQGDLVAVQTFAASLGLEMQTRFDNASSFKRANPLFNAALPALMALDAKWTAEYVDALFINAGKISD